MRYRNFLAVLLVTTTLLSLGAGFDADTTGNSKATTECNNNKDDDGDGFFDGDGDIDDDGNQEEPPDPGCVKPYYKDDSEADFYDSDATWVFNQSISAPIGPSFFRGGERDAIGTNKQYDYSKNGKLKELYVKGSNSSFGGGSLKTATVDPQGSGVHYERIREDSRALLVNAPGTNVTGSTCGDGNNNDDYGGGALAEVECPEDHGMGDIVLDDALDRYSGEEVQFDPDIDSTDLECQELKDNPGNSGTVDITGTSGTAATKDLDAKKPDGGPDFILDKGALGSGNDDRIMKVECSTDGKTVFISASDTNKLVNDELTSNTVDVAGGPTTAYESAGVISSPSRSDYCTARSGEKNEKKLVTRTEPVSVDIKVVDVTEDGDGGGKYGSGTVEVAFDVKRHVAQNDGKYRECTNKRPLFDNCRGRVCGSAERNVFELNSGVSKDTGSSSTDVKLTHPQYKLTTSEFFDVSSSDAVGNVTGGPDSPYKTSNFNFDSGAFFTDNSSKQNDFAQGNDPAVSRNTYEMEVNDSNNKFIASRDSLLISDADGPNGRGDGFIAIDDEFSSRPSAPFFAGKTDETFEAETEINGKKKKDFLDKNDNKLSPRSCPGDALFCLSSLDLKTKTSGWSTLGESWTVKKRPSEPISAGESLGTCKMYQFLNKDDQDIQCQYSGGSSPRREPVGVDPDEQYLAYMEGPEINEDVVKDNDGAQQAGVDEKTDCVLKGQEVNEGTVANVASPFKQYEKGGNSPDREVCLAKKRSDDASESYYQSGDFDESLDEEIGGEWYDLDSETVEEYLTGSGSNLINEDPDDAVIDSNDDGTTDSSDIDFYVQKNRGTQHPEFNPGAGNLISVEDDCGPGLVGCDENGTETSGKSPLFYSFLEAGKRDDDFNPLGNDSEGDDIVSDSFFSGVVVKTFDLSDQLQKGMTSSTPDPSDYSQWNWSNATAGTIDRYALAQNRTVAISTRGRVFPSGGVYPNKGRKLQRTKRNSNSTNITLRAFANSYAAVSNQRLTSQTGDNRTVPEGFGVWIDPDYLRRGFETGNVTKGSSSWEEELSFRMDLTGPDSGLGFDVPGNADPAFRDSDRVVLANITWQGENDDAFAYSSSGNEDRVGIYGPGADNTVSGLEPPMCGDDTGEYLYEEAGASRNSRALSGPYACVSEKDLCPIENNQGDIMLIERGEYINVNESTESLGRYKQDKEICMKRTSDPQGYWWDQDYGRVGGELTCNVNALYGSPGIRWFDKSYVERHPHAVTGGIDDDLNRFLEQSTRPADRYDSEPQQSSWDTDETPVPTGTTNKSVVTKGFCGGDDGSEYLATQICKTDACVTDRNHFGVARNPGSCVFDGRSGEVGNNAQPVNSSRHRRQIYSPGQSIQLDFRQPVNITCVGGEWFEQGPIVFDRENIKVPVGGQSSAAFSVINTGILPAEFKVEMDEGSTAERFSKFDTNTGAFTVEVPAKERKRYEIDINPAKSFVSQVTVRATGTNSDKAGSDTLEIEATENKATSTNSRQYNDDRNVPGITTLQLVAIAAAGLAYILSQNM